MSSKNLWLAGGLVPENEAKIHVLSPTCQYGLNVFEVIRCYLQHKGDELLCFRFKDHIDRLFRSAKILKLHFNYTYAGIQQACRDTIEANGFTEDITVRITLFVNEPGSWSYRGNCEMMVAAMPRGRLDSFEKGIKACVSSWERINDRSMSPKVKAGANYINSRMAQIEASENGYDSAILLNREGKVSEAPGACIFVVRQGKLITPPVTASILESVTRDTIIRIAREDLGIPVEERDIDRTELYICDEVFLCGTTAEIVPIVSIDKIVIGNGGIGRLTKAIRERYFDIVRGKAKEYKEWMLVVNIR